MQKQAKQPSGTWKWSGSVIGGQFIASVTALQSQYEMERKKGCTMEKGMLYANRINGNWGPIEVGAVQTLALILQVLVHELDSMHVTDVIAFHGTSHVFKS